MTYFTAVERQWRAMEPRELYASRLAERQQEIARLSGLERRISFARLAAIAIALAAAALSQGWIAASAVVAFIVLVIVHERYVRRRGHLERSASFYQSGVDRLSGRWQGRGFGGDAFLDEHHPYAADLDLFGSGSIYELLCRAVTTYGRATLAAWLKTPAATVAEIAARQAAVIELRDAVEFRERMSLAAAEVRALDLVAWSREEAVRFAPWERAAAIVLTAITVAAGVLALTRTLPPLVVVAAAALQLLFARRLQERVTKVVGGVERAEPALEQLADALQIARDQRFSAPRLTLLQESIAVEAPHEIAHLQRLVGHLDSRRNQIFVPIAMVLLWTTNLAMRIETWRRTSGAHVPPWVEALGQIEALSSLASFAFENPAYTMPRLLDGAPRFIARELGHPLIDSARRVTNDVSLDGELRLLIISGSNMSGKSTLLRSAGVAAVLAFAGGPACARSLEIAPMAIGASIRLHDSLQEGSSRFYAEILRLRQILDLAQGSLLFLLDEILHGTNSHDRRIGAEAVVRRLVESSAIGLVSTHDLALAQIVDALAPHAANVHFQDHLEEGRMVFDYRMRPGVVERSNALELMRSVGIRV